MERKGKRRIALTEDYIEWALTNVPEKLQELVGGGTFKFREHFRLVLGAADRADPMKVWPLFDEQGYIPVKTEGKVTDLYTLNKSCLNGGVNAGDHMIEIEPAANSPIEILWASIANKDVVDRKLNIMLITPGGHGVNALAIATVAANDYVAIPNNLSVVTSISKQSLTLTNKFRIALFSNNIDVNQDTEFYIIYKVFGTVPTITYTNPAGATWSDVT